MCTITNHKSLDLGSASAAPASSPASFALPIDELQRSRDGFCLVDVREKEETEAEPCTTLTPDVSMNLGSVVRDGASQLPKGKPLVFVCAEGERSALAAQAMRSQGLTAYSLTGGVVALNGPATAWFQPGWVSMLFTSTDQEKVTLAMSLALGAATQGLKPAVITMHDGVWGFAKAGENKDGTQRATEIDMGAPYKSCAEMIEKIKAKGGRFFACKSCVMHRKLKDKLDDYVEMTQGPDVVRMISGATGSIDLH